MISLNKVKSPDNTGDAVTGERIFPGEEVFDTGISNNRKTWANKGRKRYVKEETIVELAKQAGLKLCGDNCDCKSDGKVSKRSRKVERADAGVGDGEGPVGEAEVGGVESVGDSVGDAES